MTALLLTAGALAALEIEWRRLGHRPAVVDGEDLWSYHRERLEGAGRDVVALLGSSRMQIGFIPAVFADVRPGLEVVQLAVAGAGAFATLRDLAKDDGFAGLVICSLSARTLQPTRHEDQQFYVDYYHRAWGPGARAEVILATPLQERLVILQPHLGAQDVVRAWLGRRTIEPNFVRTLADRSRVADYDLVDLEKLIVRRARRVRQEMADPGPVDAEEWLRIVREVASFAERIESRGGRVAFVRFPMAGSFAALNGEFYPRKAYWDVFAANVGAIAIHAEDLRGVEQLSYPDESHLAPAAAARFTWLLTHELATSGFFDG